ncbi:MAG: hypothetical protein AAF684_03205 [Pseudomonadota bacterium]
MSVAALEEEDEIVTLAPYRERLYASVRRALGENRGDMAVIGRRFIIQADLIFEPFTDVINRPGRTVLQVLARGLTRLVPQLPEDLRHRWVLTFDIHCCDSDLLESQFPDKRALTQAQRARVAKFLADLGLHGDRILVNAYADMAPLDRGRTEKAQRKNRRIEFSLVNPFEATPAEEVEPAEAADEVGWRQIDQRKERARGPTQIRTGTAPPPPAPTPRKMTLAELHGNLDDATQKEHDALRAQKAVDAPEEQSAVEEKIPFPDDFVLPNLDRHAGFRTGMVVFKEHPTDEDGELLDRPKQPGMLQHALSAIG